METSAKNAVNSVVAADAARELDGLAGSSGSIPPTVFSRTGQTGLLTNSRFNDFEFYGPPAGRDLTL
jgi:hypothetical protein